MHVNDWQLAPLLHAYWRIYEWQATKLAFHKMRLSHQPRLHLLQSKRGYSHRSHPPSCNSLAYVDKQALSRCTQACTRNVGKHAPSTYPCQVPNISPWDCYDPIISRTTAQDVSCQFNVPNRSVPTRLALNSSDATF